jgi:hypothetical protein
LPSPAASPSPAVVPSPAAKPAASPSPSPAALTKEQYVEQANAICEADEARPEPPEPGTAADVVKALETVIADLKALRAKLGELEPPAEDRAALEEQFLGILDKQIAALEKVVPKAKETAAGGDKKAVEEVLRPVVTEVAGLAVQGAPFGSTYGLTVCTD